MRVTVNGESVNLRLSETTCCSVSLTARLALFGPGANGLQQGERCNADQWKRRRFGNRGGFAEDCPCGGLAEMGTPNVVIGDVDNVVVIGIGLQSGTNLANCGAPQKVIAGVDDAVAREIAVDLGNPRLVEGHTEVFAFLVIVVDIAFPRELGLEGDIDRRAE